MKSCGHDHTLMEDECSCDRPIMHTNSADAGLPHTSLTDHIADLENRLSQIVRISDELANPLMLVSETRTKALLIRALAS